LKQASRSGMSQMQPFHNGDRLTQPEFHKAYSNMPESFRAELIAGMVHEPPPPSLMHAEEDNLVGTLLGLYSIHTPGTQAGNNGTVVLSDEDEVQPDSFLRIRPEYGGQSTNWRKFIKGAPELVVEIALTSRAIDLHVKKDRYAKFGVMEYIVYCLEPRGFLWFDLQRGGTRSEDDGGICGSAVFPGLCINTRALLEGEKNLLIDCLLQGIRGLEHDRFAAKLVSRKG
jgi:Uma2 family endonuclease